MNDLLPQFHSGSLASLASMRRGITYSAYMLAERDTGIPYINMKSFKKGGGFNPDGIKYYSGFFTQDDLSNSSDLFVVNTDVTLDGDIVGIPILLPTELRGQSVLFSHHVTRLRLGKQIDSEYLFYLLCIDKYRRWMIRFARGTTVLMLDMVAIKKIPIDYHADKLLQRKIVTIFNSLDVAIEKTEALIEKYQQIKAGLMHDLFTRGIDTDGKLRPPREQAPELYQQTPIGWIPKEWEPLKLKEILQTSGGYLQTGPFGSQLHAHEYTYEGVPVVMPQDINDGGVDEVQIARIEESRAQSLNKHRLRIGDVIIARRGELSRSAAITGQEKGWVCGTGCFLLRLGGSDLDARFFSHMYRHELVQRQVVGLAVGSTMPSLNNEIMGKLIFPYMSKKEQTAIADKVELTETRIITLNSELDKLFKQKSGLMHDLLTGKVQVNTDQPEAAHAL